MFQKVLEGLTGDRYLRLQGYIFVYFEPEKFKE
jgi:hypothetical protein